MNSSIDEKLVNCLVSQKMDILSSDIQVDNITRIYYDLTSKYTERHYPTTYDLPQFRVNTYNTINRFVRFHLKHDLQRGKIIYRKDDKGNHYLNNEICEF